MEAPYVIASVPEPFDKNHGRILSAPVYALTGTRKRKRREVVVGIDGESINIYDIRSHNTVSSYALPPQSSLSAPPSSYVCKRAAPQRHERQTIFAVRRGVQKQDTYLTCIREQRDDTSNTGTGLRGPTRQDIKLRGDEIVNTSLLIGHDNDSTVNQELSGILVSYKSGDVDCINSDLSGVAWEYKTTTDNSAAVEVEYATLLDLDLARKGLLKGREDILAILDSPTAYNGELYKPQLLCRIVRSESHMDLQLWLLRQPSKDRIRSYHQPMQLLLSSMLPFRHGKSSRGSKYDLHEASGCLYVLANQRLTVYDFSGASPKITMEIGPKRGPYVTSFSRLSASSVLVLSPHSVAIYEQRYGSVLASLPYSISSFLQGIGKKEKLRTTGSSASDIDCLSSFPDMGVAVALAGTELVAFNISRDWRGTRRTEAKGALLIDAMWNGKHATEADLTQWPGLKKQKRERLQSWREEVDQLVLNGNVQGLEELVAKDFGFHNNQHVNESSIEGAAQPTTNGRPDSYNLWSLPSSVWDAQHLRPTKALYILSKVFKLQARGDEASGDESRLDIEIKSRNLLRWLAMTGMLSSQQIRRAISSQGTEMTSQSTLAPGAIMSAVGRIDREFVLLCDLLSLPMPWDLTEIVQTMKLLVQSLQSDDEETHSLPKLIKSTSEVTAGQDDVDAQIAAEANAAELDLKHAHAVVESGLHVRSEAFRLVLSRLRGFPARSVTSALRSMMAHDELVFFIQILRIELAGAGWTSRYTDTGEEVTEGDTLEGIPNTHGLEPSDQGIRHISDLLDCAVDSIGLSGWLIGGSSNQDDIENLIDNLRVEISAALEGCYEAHTLDVLLKEIRRCADSEPKLEQNPRSAAVSQDHILLPLGGKPEPPHVRTWHKRDSKMTNYALAEGKRQRIGNYSFERILL